MKYRYKVDLNIDRFMHTNISRDKASLVEHLFRRNCTILKPFEIVNKYYKGEIECARLDFPFKMGSKEFSHIYIYHDKSGVCPESCFHFYTEHGELLWTYPWNGQFERYKMLTCPFDDFSKQIDFISIGVVDDKIEIMDYSKSLKSNGVKTKGMTKTTFLLNGEFVKSEQVSQNLSQNKEDELEK